jgi:translin
MVTLAGMDSIERHLERLQERRDRVLEASREIVRLSGKAITLMHAERRAEAGALIRQLRSRVARLKRIEKGLEYHSLQAHQEYVEAGAFYTVLGERRLPPPQELGESEVAYLLGMMDLVGELKREAIDAMRKRDLDRAGELYEFMKDIYDSTRAMRFASSIVPDFRRKQDTARIQIESTAGELLAFEGKR